MDRLGGTGAKEGSNARITVIVVLTALMMVPWNAGPVDVSAANGSDLPDLRPVAFYNYTQVVAGEDAWFNLTIHNAGDAAYLVRKSGNLEIYGYRDGEHQVTMFERVFQDIYVNQTLVVDFTVNFDSEGTHSLSVVIDEVDRITESDETNNEATVEFEVLPGQVNKAPKADGGNDRTGHVEKPLLFSAMYSTDPNGDDLTYAWDFGDGDLGTGVRTHHSYDELGDYRVVLTVSDGELTDQDTFTMHIVDAPKNQPPVAVITASTDDVQTGVEVTMDGTSSYDPDGDTLTYVWDVNALDGVDDWILGPSVVASWDSPGVFTVNLKVSDGSESDTEEFQIHVREPPPPNQVPLANAGLDVVTVKGTEWTFVGTGMDPDGSIVSYEWDIDGDGTYDTYSELNGRVTSVFSEIGYVTMRLRVTDDDGSSNVDSMVVTVKKKEKEDKATPGMPGFTVIMIIICAALIARRGVRKGDAGSGCRGEKEDPRFK